MRLSFLEPLDRLSTSIVDGLCDPARRRRVAFILVCVYAAAWTIYGVIAKSSQDINADMAEQVVWSREPALGYPKHPPLLAFAVKLWFTVFPLADWSFILLAAVILAAGIFLAIELCGIWLDDEKRATVPFLLAAIPFYNFLGLKFDQNGTLIPIWALAMLAFMHSLETRRPGWSILTGIAAAAAILIKYWSGFLLAALAIAALADRRRGAYLRSPAPWLVALVFSVAMLPHIIWLFHEHFPPLTWITTRRSSYAIADFSRSLGEYSFGTLGYVTGALALVTFVIRPPPEAVRDSWFAIDPARRAATLLFWTPLVLPIFVAAVMRVNLLSLWNTAAFNLLPVMVLATPLVKMSRSTAKQVASIVIAITAIVVAVSPIVALAKLMTGVENDAAYARLAAVAVENTWRETTAAPLRLIAGPFGLATSAAFYMTDAPSTYADFSDYLSPWITPTRIAREGIAIICPADDTPCVDHMAVLSAAGPHGQRTEVTLARHWLGFAGAAKRFVITTIPPRP